MVKSGKNAQKRQKVVKTAGWFLCGQQVYYFVFMAKQIGILKLTGTICGICFYCIDGVYYARAKSSLSGERVKTDPAFEKTMTYAKRMGNASKIASALYREIVPKHERSRERYRQVVGMVMKELDTMDAALRRHKLNHRDRKTQRYTKKIFTDNTDERDEKKLNHEDRKTRRYTKVNHRLHRHTKTKCMHSQFLLLI